MKNITQQNYGDDLRDLSKINNTPSTNVTSNQSPTFSTITRQSSLGMHNLKDSTASIQPLKQFTENTRKQDRLAAQTQDKPFNKMGLNLFAVGDMMSPTASMSYTNTYNTLADSDDNTKELHSPN